MPINVQHGVPASAGMAALAQAAMRIRAQKEAAALAAVSRGGGGGGRSSGGGGNLAQQKYDLAAQQAYYAKESDERKYEQEGGQMEQKSQLEMEGFEYEYSAKQRMKIAQLNNAKQEIQNSENFSQEEKLSATRHLELQLGNMAPTASPVDPNKPSYAGTEKDVGLTWPNETGGISTRNPDGKVVELTEYSKTEKGIERTAQIKQKEERQKRVWELLAEEIKYIDPKDGQEKTERRKPAAVFKILKEEQEVMDMLENHEQEKLNAAEAAAAIQEGAERLPEEDAWIRQAQESGLPITEADIDLGPDIGPKQAMLRKLTIDSQQRTLTKEEKAMKRAITEELLAISGDEQAGSFAIREPEPEPDKKLRRRKLSSTGALSGMLRHT